MKTELIVIMTPHIVYGKADIERVLGEEARRMDWIMSDVLRTHGTYGMEPIIPKKDPGAGTPVPAAQDANYLDPMAKSKDRRRFRFLRGPRAMPLRAGQCLSSPVNHRLI